MSGDAENARPENAGLENAGPIDRGGKCGKRHYMEYRVFLMSV